MKRILLLALSLLFLLGACRPGKARVTPRKGVLT